MRKFFARRIFFCSVNCEFRMGRPHDQWKPHNPKRLESAELKYYLVLTPAKLVRNTSESIRCAEK